MSRSTKQDWLDGPGDLEEDTLEDLPVKGKTIVVRALPAAFSNKAQTDATVVKATPDGGAMVTVDKAKMEALQFAHGVVEPQFSEEDAEKVAEKYGPAFRKVIDRIDELSAIDKEAIEEAQARFPGVDEPKAPEAHANGGPSTPSSGGSGPDVPARTGAGTGKDD